MFDISMCDISLVVNPIAINLPLIFQLPLTISVPLPLIQSPSLKDSPNVLALPDDDFSFILGRISFLRAGKYYPVTPDELSRCCSLVNHRVLKACALGGYALTSQGKKLFM